MSKPHNVYIMRMGDTSYYKIGISKNPEKRLLQINVGPIPTFVICEYESREDNSYKVVLQIEQDILKRYSHKRMHSEWLNLTRVELTEIDEFICAIGLSSHYEFPRHQLFNVPGLRFMTKDAMCEFCLLDAGDRDKNKLIDPANIILEWQDKSQCFTIQYTPYTQPNNPYIHVIAADNEQLIIRFVEYVESTRQYKYGYGYDKLREMYQEFIKKWRLAE